MGFCRANSVTWNPHKMMGVPLQCSAILVREKVREGEEQQCKDKGTKASVHTDVCC